MPFKGQKFRVLYQLKSIKARDRRKHYDGLLKNGMLKKLFPELSGDWEKDHIKFRKLIKENKV